MLRTCGASDRMTSELFFFFIICAVFIETTLTRIISIYHIRSRIRPVQSLSVSVVAMGEGWHNYHHVFPWDYKAAELGNYFNVTTFWINQFAKIGWAYDLKQPSAEMIKNTILKHGN